MNKPLLTATLLTFFACNTAPEEQNIQHQSPASQNFAAVENTLTFDTYCNGRYGYCIDYPKGMVYPQPESTNSDGRIFTNKKGDTTLMVFGRTNTDVNGSTISLKQQYNEELQGVGEDKDRVITYKTLGKTFFVISGYKKDKIFYQKTIVKEDAFAYAILWYNKNEKNIYDPISERISKSFK